MTLAMLSLVLLISTMPMLTPTFIAPSSHSKRITVRERSPDGEVCRIDAIRNRFERDSQHPTTVGHFVYVVLDELHTLRGIFGTHVAHVLRNPQD